MPRVVIAAIVVVILLAYGMFFATWNLTPVKVVGLRIGADEYWEEIPVAYLPLAGFIIGVVGMSIAALLQWRSNRAHVDKLNQQIEKARQVLEQQKRRISELEEELAQVQQALAEAREALAAEAASAEDEGQEQAVSPEASEPSADVDEEVI